MTTLLREPDWNAPRMKRKDLLRGSFVLVEYAFADGTSDTRLVLLGFTPQNRKLVFEVENAVGMLEGVEYASIGLLLVQDSPGMARDVAS